MRVRSCLLVTQFLVVTAISTAFILVPQSGGMAAGGSSTSHCQDMGVSQVPEQIIDNGSQDCAWVSLGFGLPGVGQMQIMGFGSHTCPVTQTKVDFHHDCTPKEGFECESNGFYAIWTRDVNCSSAANCVLVGFPYCEAGDWMVQSNQPDWMEEPCEFDRPSK